MHWPIVRKLSATPGSLVSCQVGTRRFLCRFPRSIQRFASVALVILTGSWIFTSSVPQKSLMSFSLPTKTHHIHYKWMIISPVTPTIIQNLSVSRGAIVDHCNCSALHALVYVRHCYMMQVKSFHDGSSCRSYLQSRAKNSRGVVQRAIENFPGVATLPTTLHVWLYADLRSPFSGQRFGEV